LLGLAGQEDVIDALLEWRALQVLGETIDLVEELLEMLGPAADVLGCSDELAATRDILGSGTSAHRQVAVYEAAMADGAEVGEALRAVVDYLIEETTRLP